MTGIARIQAALNDAQRNISDIREAIDATAPPCRQCKYARERSFSADCGHPAVTKLSFTAHTGEVTVSRPQVYVARGNGGICGPRGILFETTSHAARVRRFFKRNAFFLAMAMMPALLVLEIIWLARR